MTDAIPLEYGDLVGASPVGDSGWALLFFQRPDKSIVGVYVNAHVGSSRTESSISAPMNEVRQWTTS